MRFKRPASLPPRSPKIMAGAAFCFLLSMPLALTDPPVPDEATADATLAQDSVSQPAAAQDVSDEAATADDSQEKVVLEKPARTVEEALERRSAEEATAAKELEAARARYKKRLAEVNGRAVAHLPNLWRINC